MTRASDTAKLLGAGATILDGTTISTADNTTQLTLTSTDADANTGPNLVLQRDSASPADNDLSGTIKFIADNDAGEATDCVSIFSKIIDASNGSEDASLLVNSIVGGSQISRFNITPTEIAINEDSIDLDFRVEGNGNANVLFVEGETDRVAIGHNDPSQLLDVRGTGVVGVGIGSTNAGGVQLILDGDSNGDFSGSDYCVIKHDDAGRLDIIQDSPSGTNDMRFFTGGTDERMRISAGNAGVFLGTTSTSGTVEGTSLRTGTKNMCVMNSSTVFIFNRHTNDGTVISFNQANTAEGSVSVSGNTVSYNAFSGSHWSRLADNSKPTILKGTVIETIDEMCDWYQAEFTIAKTEDTPEITEKVSVALPDGKSVGDTMSVTHEGITYDNAKILKEDDNKHTKCKISATADSKRVYGVFASFDNDDDTVNDMYVTAVGTHVVRINKDVTVTAGDLLSSNGDGTAKVQDDDIIRSKTIGKVLTNLKQETYSDGSYTVPCALYCG